MKKYTQNIMSCGVMAQGFYILEQARYDFISSLNPTLSIIRFDQLNGLNKPLS